MLVDQKASIPVLSPPVVIHPNNVDLSHSRKLLKPVPLSSHDNNSMNQNKSLSPRKRVLLQLKSKQQQSTKQSFGSKLNKRLSLRRESKSSISDKLFKKTVKKEIEAPPIKKLPEIKKTDVKKVLYHHEHARITCFESSPTQANSSFEFMNSNDRILGHGSLEIYSIHENNTVNYLQCGTVIYPILPKLKILRINLNQFILPLSNPERYWLISMTNENEQILNELEKCLQKICSYRNLYILESKEQITRNDSISSDLACLNLSKIESNPSSLDLELDKFEETLTSFHNHSKPKSCSSSILTDYPTTHNVKHKYSNNTNITDMSPNRKPSFDTLRSRNSLYQVEPSWMNIDEYDSSTFSGVIYDQKTLTNSIMFQNLHKLRKEESLAKLSQQQILGIVKDNEDVQINEKSMIAKIFGW